MRFKPLLPNLDSTALALEGGDVGMVIGNPRISACYLRVWRSAISKDNNLRFKPLLSNLNSSSLALVEGAERLSFIGNPRLQGNLLAAIRWAIDAGYALEDEWYDYLGFVDSFDTKESNCWEIDSKYRVA